MRPAACVSAQRSKALTAFAAPAACCRRSRHIVNQAQWTHCDVSVEDGPVLDAADDLLLSMLALDLGDVELDQAQFYEDGMQTF